MSAIRRRALGLALALLVYGLDQWIKGLLLWRHHLSELRVIEILPFFDLRWTVNYGISLGLLTANSAEMRWLLVALTAAVALAVLVWMLREKRMGDIAPLAMVLGGAMGNIHDRVAMGFVFDYADLHFGEFRPFLIFNFADAAISVGVVIILARSFLSREKPQDPAPDGEGATSEN